jgi:hypothetical protein
MDWRNKGSWGSSRSCWNQQKPPGWIRPILWDKRASWRGQAASSPSTSWQAPGRQQDSSQPGDWEQDWQEECGCEWEEGGGWSQQEAASHSSNSWQAPGQQEDWQAAWQKSNSWQAPGQQEDWQAASHSSNSWQAPGQQEDWQAAWQKSNSWQAPGQQEDSQAASSSSTSWQQDWNRPGDGDQGWQEEGGSSQQDWIEPPKEPPKEPPEEPACDAAASHETGEKTGKKKKKKKPSEKALAYRQHLLDNPERYVEADGNELCFAVGFRRPDGWLLYTEEGQLELRRAWCNLLNLNPEYAASDKTTAYVEDGAWTYQIELYRPGSKAHQDNLSYFLRDPKMRHQFEEFDVDLKTVVGQQFNDANKRFRPVGLPQHIPGNENALRLLGLRPPGHQPQQHVGTEVLAVEDEAEDKAKEEAKDEAEDKAKEEAKDEAKDEAEEDKAKACIYIYIERERRSARKKHEEEDEEEDEVSDSEVKRLCAKYLAPKEEKAEAADEDEAEAQKICAEYRASKREKAEAADKEEDEVSDPEVKRLCAKYTAAKEKAEAADEDEVDSPPDDTALSVTEDSKPNSKQEADTPQRGRSLNKIAKKARRNPEG